MSRKNKKISWPPLTEEWVDAVHGGKPSFGVCLVYPNTYEVGMCNLGLHSVYRIINDHPSFFVERSFLPGGYFSHQKGGAVARASEVVSVESRRHLSSFDIMAFSISFEGDYLNILKIMTKAKIPLLSKKRSDKHPLVIAGGVAVSLNPEPLADFFDFFFICEAEGGFADVLSRIAEYKRRRLSTNIVLSLIPLNCPSVYCPSLYDVIYNEEGAIAEMAPRQNEAPAKISRGTLDDWETWQTYQAMLPLAGRFSDMFLMEISRECPHRCRFCAATYCYQPARFRSFASQKHLLDEGIRRRGKVGLVGTAVSDHPEIKNILALHKRAWRKGGTFIVAGG